jgi:hypothetical protein
MSPRPVGGMSIAGAKQTRISIHAARLTSQADTAVSGVLPSTRSFTTALRPK